MQKQQGAALIIALVLLSVSLVIGMSGMSAALVDERLAGNYRAAALAQMAAEDMAVWVIEDGFQDAEQWTPPDSTLDDTQVSDQFALERRYGNCVQGGMCTDANLFIVRGRVIANDHDGLVIAEHFLEVGQTGGDIDTPGDFPSTLSATLLCVGDSCPTDGSASISNYFMGAANLPNSFDCNGSGCRPGGGSRENENPQTNNEFFENSYNKSNNIDEWEAFVNQLSGEEVSSGSLSQGSPGIPRIIEVVPGDEVKSSGNTNTLGIIVVRRGAEFRANGTGSHEGIIIVEGSKGVPGEPGFEPAGQITLGNNFSLYGSLVSFNSIDNINASSPTPNGGARYNASALTGLPAGGGLVWSSL